LHVGSRGVSGAPQGFQNTPAPFLSCATRLNLARVRVRVRFRVRARVRVSVRVRVRVRVGVRAHQATDEDHFSNVEAPTKIPIPTKPGCHVDQATSHLRS